MAEQTGTRTRSPWLAAFIAVPSTFLAMLYLGRGRRAIAYLGLYLFAAVLDQGMGRILAPAGLVAAVWIAGIADAYRIARLHQASFAGPWYSRWPVVAGVPLGLVALALTVRTFVWEPFHVPSASMLPTLWPGDYILVSKWGYGNYGTFGLELLRQRGVAADKRPGRGEVVMFRPPDKPDVYYVKRVIGLPGDEVSFRGAHLFVNGEPVLRQAPGAFRLADPLVDGAPVHPGRAGGAQHGAVSASPAAPLTGAGTVTVAEGHYFLVGDNRDNSHDSRHWGTVPERDIIGRPLWIWYSRTLAGEVRWGRIGQRVR